MCVFDGGIYVCLYRGCTGGVHLLHRFDGGICVPLSRMYGTLSLYPDATYPDPDPDFSTLTLTLTLTLTHTNNPDPDPLTTLTLTNYPDPDPDPN